MADPSGRGLLGALQNRLGHTLGAGAAELENFVAAESRIRDADVASEVVSLTRARIAQAAQTALLAQARDAERSRVLGLLAA